MLHDVGHVLLRTLLQMLIYSRKDEMYASANLIIPSRRRHLRRRVYRTETADSCPTCFPAVVGIFGVFLGMKIYLFLVERFF